MSFKLSSRVAAPLLLTSLSFFTLHCSSDEGTPDNTAGAPTAGTGGAASTAGSTSGGSSGSGGAPTAGASGTAGATGGGGSSAGGTGGSGGSTGGGGSGGSAGGAGGSGGTGGSGGAGGSGGTGGTGGSGGTGGAGGSGGAGGGSATFGPVKQLLAMSCAGNMCHSAQSSQIDLVTSDGLHGRLTSAIPNDVPHCPGDKPIVAMDQNSLILRLVKGSTMCTKSGGGMESIARMPDHCGEQGRPPCLTEAQIKVISDWVTAGAPM